MSWGIRSVWYGAFLLAASRVDASPAQYVDGQLVVRFQEDVITTPDGARGEMALADVEVRDEATRELLESVGIDRVRPVATYWWNVDRREYYDLEGNRVFGLVDFNGTFVVRLREGIDTPSARAALERSGLADYAAFDEYVLPLATCCEAGPLHPNDSRYDDQWGLHNDGSFPGSVADVDVNMPEAWCIQNICTKKIGVIDSGVRSTHEDLAASYDATLSKCFMTSGCSPGEDTSGGHGTQVAGIAAAATRNLNGVASPGGGWEGTNNRCLVSLREALLSETVDAIAYACSTGSIPVLNMSYGVGDDDNHSVVRANGSALKNCFIQGVFPVAATGNDEGGSPPFPAAFDRLVLGTGHILKNDARNPLYMEGFHIDVVAPGGAEIVTTSSQGDFSYNNFSGTSASSPLAAGVAALLWSWEPSLINEDIGFVLQVTAKNKGEDTGWDPKYGWGLVRADTAMRFVSCDNVLKKNTATGSTSLTFVAHRPSQQFRNVIPGPISGTNWQTVKATVWKMKKTVTFPEHSGTSPLTGKAWARGRLCSTWKDTTRYDGDWEPPWAGIENVGSQTADVYGYFYQVWNADSTVFHGWFPFNPMTAPPSTIKWAYAYVVPAVQSREGDVTVAIEGPRLWTVPGTNESSIHVILPESTDAAIEILDISGRSLRRWDFRRYEKGKHVIAWDRRSTNGMQANPGVYLVRLALGNGQVTTTKLLLQRSASPISRR